MSACLFCEREVTWLDHAVNCDVCDRWQHRLCHTGIDREQYLDNNRRNVEFEFICGPCQADLQPPEVDAENYVFNDFVEPPADIYMEEVPVEFEMVSY